MSNRENVNVIEFVPENLAKNEDLKAFTESLQTQVDEVSAAIPTIELYQNIDALPEPILRMLAVENRVYLHEWEFATTIEAKRQLIKDSFELNQRRGTRWAVERVFELLDINAYLQEWFEYGGTPYRFRVIVNRIAGEQVTQEQLDKLSRLVDHYKPLRSAYDLLQSVTSEGAFGFVAAVRPATWARHEFEETGYSYLLVDDDTYLVDDEGAPIII